MDARRVTAATAERPFVYFARAAETDLVKIGVSADVDRRLVGLRSATGLHVCELGRVPGDYSTEAALHRLLSPHRHHGEWYRPTREVLAALEAARIVAAGLEYARAGRPRRRPRRYLYPQPVEKPGDKRSASHPQ